MIRNDRRKPDSGIPPGLPDHLRSPVIPLDPELSPANRRFQAFQAFGSYLRELSGWLPPGYSVQAVQAALGTTFADYLRLADEVGPEYQREPESLS